MSVHEFVTVACFYLGNLPLMSKALVSNILEKVTGSVTEFNELQLLIFAKTLERMFIEERKQVKDQQELMFQGDKQLAKQVETCYLEI